MVDILNNIDLDNIFVYMVKMPDNVREAVTPSFCGYTVYINQNLTHEQRQKAFAHALKHIQNRDFEKSDVQAIEYEAHR